MKRGNPKDANRNISKDWRGFAIRLSGVLEEMVEDQMLIISEKHTNRFVQFAAQGGFGMRAEISSNAYLSQSDRITDMQVAQLIKAGWKAPTGGPSEATPENDPDGSPNFFIDYPARIRKSQISNQAVTALSEIMRIPHPGYLEYEALDTDGNALVWPQLGIRHRQTEEIPDLAKVARRLLSCLREITGLKHLGFHEDGDICLKYGSITMFVRVIGNPPLIRLYAPLVQRVRETPKLHSRLNELNSGVGFMHFFVRDRIIYAISEINASPLQYSTLAKALRMFSEIADGIDEKLEAEFGGKAMRVENVKSTMIH